jgi:SAM-dependent methyltransferase
MSTSDQPIPGVMPLDRERWKDELHLSQFINSFYQYRDVSTIAAPGSRILIIGPGVGLDTAVLRWRGYRVTTFDIDETFNPDVLGSCHDMSMFESKSFDVAIASHVLEHLPIRFLDQALSEIFRVAGHALIFLPVAGKHAKIGLSPRLRGHDVGIVMDFFKFWQRPSGTELEYRGGQHYWEVGYVGFRVSDIVRRLSNFSKVMHHYRNRDWLPSYNFVCQAQKPTQQQE